MGGLLLPGFLPHSWLLSPSGTAIVVLILLNVSPRHVPVNGALKELFRVLQMSAVAYACGMELCLANSCSYVTDTVSAHKTEQREKCLGGFSCKKVTETAIYR